MIFDSEFNPPKLEVLEKQMYFCKFARKYFIDGKSVSFVYHFVVDNYQIVFEDNEHEILVLPLTKENYEYACRIVRFYFGGAK